MPDGHLLHFGPYQLDLRQEQFWCDGQPVRLPPKVFQVLSYLAERPGQLVTKEELFRVVWPDTVVGDAALTMCIQEIRKALGDNAREPQYIETVPRRGFRFIGEVVSSQHSVVSRGEERSQEEARQTPALSFVEGTKVEEAETGTEKTEDGDAGLRTPDAGRLPLPIAMPRRFRWWQVVLLLVVLILGGGLAANWRLVRLVAASYFPPPAPEPLALPLPDKPSLVVLPLVNLSGDSSQEYFSDGLTDDLINTLAQFPDLFVISRHSASTYKGKTLKEQEVAKELGARYVLTGSVRRADEQVRLNVQLVGDKNPDDGVRVHDVLSPFL